MLGNENKAKIFIIKEAKDFNNVIRNYFQQKEYDVEISTNSSDIVNKAIKSKANMIIVDIDTTNTSSFIVSEKIKSSDELKNIPVVIASQGKQIFIDKNVSEMNMLPVNSFKSFRDNRTELYN